MNILNIYYSLTNNTELVAKKIINVCEKYEYNIESIQITDEELYVDVLSYDLIFAGSGVYQWLPGKTMQKLFNKLRKEYVSQKKIIPSSPRLHGKKAIIYCTYGGVHTGINEAIPAVKYMGQLFDHLGIDIFDEWYIVGEYRTNKLKHFSSKGRLGNIEGRPNTNDLYEIEQKVCGVLQSY